MKEVKTGEPINLRDQKHERGTVFTCEAAAQAPPPDVLSILADLTLKLEGRT